LTTTHDSVEPALPTAGPPAAFAPKFGFAVALATGLMTVLTFSLAVATPPRSGQLCQASCFTYPYLGIAARFPRDYFWMLPAIVATLLYTAFAVALYGRAAPDKRPVAQLGLVLSGMAALTLVGDYFVQLAVIQPSVLAGEGDGISLLTQYNPHGLFIALEEMGYLLMSLSLVCMSGALTSATRLERVVRWLFVGGFVVNVLGLSWYLARHGHLRGYLFEILVISVDWIVLIGAAFMMAIVFRRDISYGRARTLHGEATLPRAAAGRLRKVLLVCGVLSSVVYIAADVVSGLSWAAYSFTSQTISELSALGAPSRPTWLAFGIPYDLLLIAFGVGVWGSASQKRGLRVTAALLVAIGAIGSVWPPMHVRGSVTTLTDTLHIVWAGVISLLILLAIGFGSGTFGRRFRVYSLATIAVLLVSGTLTSLYGPRIAANQPTPGVGILERIDLAGYLVWTAVLAVALLRTSRRRGP
jgi:hypothetical protein